MRSFVNAETQLRFNQPGTALNRILTEAPYLPRCSDNKTAALVRPAHYAIRYPYMQVNRTGMVSWLIFDLDHTNANIWDDVGLPAPNLIVRNRRNGHAHLYYAVVPVCTSENARAKPIQYMKAIYSAMAQKMEADEAYSGPVAKTPGHPWWATTEVHNKEYELGELAESVELVVTRWGTGPNMDAVSHSRHCTIFEELRFYAYSIVAGMRDTSSYTSFIRRLDAFAHNHNNFERRGFSSNLTVSQVKATVRSVARWTWDNYTGCSRCHRGAMSLDPTLPLYERQKLSAKRTHEKRQSKTESKIRLACRQLLDRGEKLRQSVIAKLTALTRQTVAKYKHIINETVAQPDSVILFNGEASGAVENVNHGVHQISAFSPCLVIGTVIHSPPLSAGSSLSDTDTLLNEELWPDGGDG
ncbi:TPA: replication initiation protein [Yersinia enterocolitica]